MAKNKSIYICSKCGFESIKWYGKCPGCSEWNTMNEEIINVSKNLSSSKSIHKSQNKPILIQSVNIDDEHRYHTGIKEFDRVLGGGIVKGSVVLLGGEPGIGKSTIIMQVCNYISKKLKVLYVSGEESKRQLKMRATRLDVNSEKFYLMTETDVQNIIEEIKNEKPDLVIIDSIQTSNISDISSASGSVTQVRESAVAFTHIAKSLDIPIIIIGHVNKDGAIAGPKVLEHIVDTVLYFEGDRQMTYRMIRAAKNRYGPTNEIGIFEMGKNGLYEIENPSMMFLSGRPTNVSGIAVACIMEGSRPIFAEIQGLATSSGFGNPRRMATGFDYNRMSLLLAVLEKRAGYYFSNLDSYINVVGGIKLDEPACDLGVSLSLISSLKDIPIPDDTVLFGEIGLAGELRAVNFCEARIIEAKRLGFKRCIFPYYNYKKFETKQFSDIKLIGAKSVREAFEILT